MTRMFLALGATLLTVGAARAADPQPLWEVETAVEKMRPIGLPWVSLSPDGKMLLARVEFCPERKPDPFIIQENFWRLVTWDTTTRKEKFNLDLGTCHGGEFRWGVCALTDDEHLLVSGGAGREVQLRDGKLTTVSDPRLHTLGVWFNPKTRRTIWWCGDEGELGLTLGELPVLDGTKPQAAAKWTTDFHRLTDADRLDCFVVDRDVKRIALTAHNPEDDSRRGTLRLLSISDEFKVIEVAKVPTQHQGSVISAQFSPDGKTLALGSMDCSLSLWDVTKVGKEWKPYATIPAGRFTVSCLAFNPDGRTLAAGTSDNKLANLYRIDVRGGKLVSSRALGGRLSSLAYSSDGKLLATGDGTGKVRVWDAAALRGD